MSPNGQQNLAELDQAQGRHSIAVAPSQKYEPRVKVGSGGVLARQEYNNDSMVRLGNSALSLMDL